MDIYASKELKFIHITKCAGTFVENIGHHNCIEWGANHKEYGFWHDIFIDKPKELKDKYDWFVVVRNPYDRVLSEYYCKWGGIGNQNIVHTTEEFNLYLIEKINNRNCSAPGHYLEQYKYIDTEVVINIIKFENLNKELINLFAKYNIDIDVEKYEKVNSKENKNKDMLFTVDDFNNQLIKTINNVYEKDFSLFDYEMKRSF